MNSFFNEIYDDIVENNCFSPAQKEDLKKLLCEINVKATLLVVTFPTVDEIANFIKSSKKAISVFGEYAVIVIDIALYYFISSQLSLLEN